MHIKKQITHFVLTGEVMKVTFGRVWTAQVLTWRRAPEKLSKPGWPSKRRRFSVRKVEHGSFINVHDTLMWGNSLCNLQGSLQADTPATSSTAWQTNSVGLSFQQHDLNDFFLYIFFFTCESFLINFDQAVVTSEFPQCEIKCCLVYILSYIGCKWRKI